MILSPEVHTMGPGLPLTYFTDEATETSEGSFHTEAYVGSADSHRNNWRHKKEQGTVTGTVRETDKEKSFQSPCIVKEIKQRGLARCEPHIESTLPCSPPHIQQSEI